MTIVTHISDLVGLKTALSRGITSVTSLAFIENLQLAVKIVSPRQEEVGTTLPRYCNAHTT